MRIEIRGRNVEVDDELREHVFKRFRRVGKQVSELATLEVDDLGRAQPRDRRQPGRRGDAAAQGCDAARQGVLAGDGAHVHELAEDIRRQVKKHREMRRKRSRTRKLVNQVRGRTAEA